MPKAHPLPPAVLVRDPKVLGQWPQVRLVRESEPHLVPVGQTRLVLLDAQIQFLLTVADERGEGCSAVLPDQKDRLVVGLDLEQFRALAQEVETMATEMEQPDR